jgi:signal transduction histidine kinase
LRLSEFITENHERILQEFENFARNHSAPAETMDTAALRDDAAGILRAIALDLQQPRTPSSKERKAKGAAPRRSGAGATSAETHGAERAASGFSLRETVSEFRALRASVLRLWRAAAGPRTDETAVQDVDRFHEAIDQVLAESIGRYAFEIEKLQGQRAAEAVAEDVARAKTDFLQIVSHELRTPLNAIVGYTSLLRMGTYGSTTEGQEGALGRMKRAEERLLGIIDGLLDFQDTGTGTPYELEEISVQDATQGVTSIVEPTANEHEVEFDMDVQADGARIRVDRERLRQVLVNLISNGVRFTQRGGRVWLDYVETPEKVCLRVHDTGPGIPTEKLEAIFEPFVQLDMGLTRERGGVGLGLAVSRRLTEGMGGTLTAESEIGKGSVFTVSLPRLTAETR